MGSVKNGLLPMFTRSLDDWFENIFCCFEGTRQWKGWLMARWTCRRSGLSNTSWDGITERYGLLLSTLACTGSSHPSLSLNLCGRWIGSKDGTTDVWQDLQHEVPPSRQRYEFPLIKQWHSQTFSMWMFAVHDRTVGNGQSHYGKKGAVRCSQ